LSGLLLSQPYDGYQYASILAALVALLSRGNVTTKSADTNDLPLINPNWLTAPTDQEVAVVAYKRVRQAFASKYMAPVLTNKTKYYPSPDVKTDEQILITFGRHCIQCGMRRVRVGWAKKETRMLWLIVRQVFGVKGLRVVDASSLALLPPGHPQSTIYALAEKISEDILVEH
jgi:choline dehydrogenase